MTPCFHYPSSIPGHIHPKNKFSKEEDMLLKQIVEKFGTNDWKIIAKEMPGRNPRQCRDRWQGYLSPHISNEPWTEKEDQLLVQKYEEFGPRWKYISTFFPNRTDINIKSRWQIRQRRLKKEELAKMKLEQTKMLLHEDSCCKRVKINTQPPPNACCVKNETVSHSLPIPKFTSQEANNNLSFFGMNSNDLNMSNDFDFLCPDNWEYSFLDIEF